MLFRSDCDFLNRMTGASDLYWALVTAPAHLAVIELIAETLLSALEKFVFGDASCHSINVWDQQQIQRESSSHVMDPLSPSKEICPQRSSVKTTRVDPVA